MARCKGEFLIFFKKIILKDNFKQINTTGVRFQNKKCLASTGKI